MEVVLGDGGALSELIDESHDIESILVIVAAAPLLKGVDIGVHKFRIGGKY